MDRFSEVGRELSIIQYISIALGFQMSCIVLVLNEKQSLVYTLFTYAYYSVIRVILFLDGNTIQFLTYSLICFIHLHVFFLDLFGKRINETLL